MSSTARLTEKVPSSILEVRFTKGLSVACGSPDEVVSCSCVDWQAAQERRSRARACFMGAGGKGPEGCEAPVYATGRAEAAISTRGFADYQSVGA